MITHNDIILLVTTIAIFCQGFYLGRRQMLRFGIASLTLLLLSITSITLNGLYTYSGAILDVNTYEAVVAIIYVAFWWGLGYFISHLVLIKENNICKVEIMKVK
jgi:hypothetical protein